MDFEDGFFDLLIKRGLGLDEEKDFFGSFFFTAPAVMGFEIGKKLNARGKASGN